MHQHNFIKGLVYGRIGERRLMRCWNLRVGWVVLRWLSFIWNWRWLIIVRMRFRVRSFLCLVSAMKAKRAAKLFREMGEHAFVEGNVNLALRNYMRAVECSRFYVDRYDIDLAKSLICLSKVHA